MDLFQRRSFLWQNDQEVGRPYVTARDLGIKYQRGTKRDDLQSLAYRKLLGRRESQQSGEFWALKGVDLNAQAGEIVGIIGPNGAGKSTLCKAIAGILLPDTGSLEVKGEVFSLLSVGAGFLPELTGRENVLQNGMMLGMSRCEVEALLPEIINYSGLEKFVDQPLKRYSSGMRARLGFSVAAMVKPQILILDETLSVGDAEFNRKAADKMQELVQQASVVIVVTHQVDFVSKHCTKAMWMEGGRVRMSGNPLEVVSAYRASVPPQAPKITHVLNLRETKSQGGTEEVVSVKGLSLEFPLQRTQPGSKGRLSGLRAKAEPFWALRDVTFRVCHGDILGIIGRNGAGKTTLCRVLSGILKPDIGHVAMYGKTTALLTLGTGFNDQLTGRDNIFLYGMMLGISKSTLAQLYDEIVAFSELQKSMDIPLKQYSRGMRSRLAFSIAATIQPDVLLVDEALAVGDLAFYERASAKMQELMERAKAVILVTHDMSFVKKVCTRAVWLDGGAIRLEGDPTEVVSHYLEGSKR